MVEIHGTPDIFCYPPFWKCDKVYSDYGWEHTFSNTGLTSASLITHTPPKQEHEAYISIIHKEFPWSTTGWINIVVQVLTSHSNSYYYNSHNDYILIVKQNPESYAVHTISQISWMDETVPKISHFRDHVLIFELKSSNSNITIINLIAKVMTMEGKTEPAILIKLDSTMSINMSRHSPLQCVFWPGKVQELNFYLNSLHQSSLHLYWIYDKFSKYKFLKVEPKKCIKTQYDYTFSYRYCLNFSIINKLKPNSNKYYVFYRKFFLNEIEDTSDETIYSHGRQLGR